MRWGALRDQRAAVRGAELPLLSRFDSDPSVYGLAFGTLDDDPGEKPKLHVFVAYKAPWHDITDGLPQFPGLPGQTS